MSEIRFNFSYNWSDHELLEKWLAESVPAGGVVLELASGPNICTPWTLARLGRGARYIAVELDWEHLMLQRGSLDGQPYLLLLADSCQLPLADESADVAVFHHAIDDVFETRGKSGVQHTIAEAARALKPGGYMIFSHCELVGDEATFGIDLDFARQVGAGCGLVEVRRESAAAQDWLLVHKPERR